MIIKKEFYFVRHGQTDHNISSANRKTDHPSDIPLNATGRSQALAIEKTIAALPIRTICASPLRRVQETKELICTNLLVPHHNIEDLGECTALIWDTMAALGMYSPLPEEGIVRAFMDRVKNGLNHALSLPGPVLVVAHGGVHWALCHLMGIQQHNWVIDNCVPVHFYLESNVTWRAKML